MSEGILDAPLYHVEAPRASERQQNSTIDTESLQSNVTSQLDSKDWHAVIGDEPIAAAICDGVGA